MPIRNVSRISGTGVQIEDPPSSWKVTRQSSGTLITTSSPTSNTWLHFPIPTPVQIDGVKMKSTEAAVSFQTTGGGKVTEVKVSDGFTIVNSPGLNLTGSNTFAQGIANDPLIFRSLVVSIFVQLPAISDSIQLFWAEVNFDG